MLKFGIENSLIGDLPYYITWPLLLFALIYKVMHAVKNTARFAKTLHICTQWQIAIFITNQWLLNNLTIH